MLTVRTEEFDKWLAFNIGADDYVSKPFSPGIGVSIVSTFLKAHNMP